MATNYTIQIDQYADYQLVVTWVDSSGNPINLTGYTAVMKAMRADGTTVDWSSYLTLGGSAGTITLGIPGAQTSGYTSNSPFSYDLLLTSSGNIDYRIIQGNVVINPGISH